LCTIAREVLVARWLNYPGEIEIRRTVSHWCCEP